MPWIMLTDVIDEDELVSGQRREGLISSLFVFLNKLTVGISLAVSGYALAAGGYDNSGGQDPPPTAELDFVMRLLCGIVPICLVLLVYPLLYFFPITHAKHLEINARIVALRERERTGASVADPTTPVELMDLARRGDADLGSPSADAKTDSPTEALHVPSPREALGAESAGERIDSSSDGDVYLHLDVRGPSGADRLPSAGSGSAVPSDLGDGSTGS